MTTLYTIGHSNHSLARYQQLLDGQGITVLVDVRSRPYSKWAPQFQKANLSRAVCAAGGDYVFLGHALGGLLDDPELFDDDGKLDYERRAAAPDFVVGLESLIELAVSDRVAITCAEEDPRGCHRTRLITPALQRRGLEVLHIRGDGRVQSDDELRDPSRQLALF